MCVCLFNLKDEQVKGALGSLGGVRHEHPLRIRVVELHVLAVNVHVRPSDGKQARLVTVARLHRHP